MAQGEWKASFEEKCRFARIYYRLFFNCLWSSTLRQHGQDGVEQMNYQMIRRHQREFFLPGLKKLGLENEASDAIAAAKYHVLSNKCGGNDVAYIEAGFPLTLCHRNFADSQMPKRIAPVHFRGVLRG